MIKRIDKALTAFENAVLVAGLFTCTIILFVNVVLRYFFASGITWAEEYAKYAIMWVTFAGCGAAVRENSHMSITALLDVQKNKKVIYWIRLIINVICVVFSLFIAVYGYRIVELVTRTKQKSPAMQIPMAVVYVSVLIGGILMTIRFCQSMARLIKERHQTGEEGVQA